MSDNKPKKLKTSKVDDLHKKSIEKQKIKIGSGPIKPKKPESNR